MYKERLDELKKWVWSLWNNRDIENTEFEEISKELNKIFLETKDHKCLWILSEMYVVKSIWAKKNAAEFSMKGLELISSHGGLHDNFSVALNGPEIDFKKKNHNKIIKFYYKYIEKYPEDLISRRILIENLIDNFRFSEAKKEIESAKKVAKEKVYFLEFHLGEILYKSGNQEDALELWNDIIEKNKNNHQCYFLLAEQYATYARYDEAVEYYLKSFEMQSKPRRIDALQTVVQLYEIKEDKRSMLETLETIIEVYREDYGIIDGEAEEFYRHRAEIIEELNQ